MISMCRFGPEGLSYDEGYPLVGKKVFSELREGEAVDSLVAEIKISSNLKSIFLEIARIRCLRKEEVLRKSSNMNSSERDK